MIKFLLSVITLLSFQVMVAQDFRFGKVSEDELRETEHSLEPNATAAILFREESIYFRYVNKEGFKQFRRVHERVKIYGNNGYKWATQKIVLYDETKSKNQEVVNLKGYTYNLKDGKMEKTRLNDSGQFIEDAREYWNIFSFTMPNIQNGCVIEYEYDIQSPYLGMNPIYLQSEIPINKLDVTISTPEYFLYNKLLNPKASFTPILRNSISKHHQDIVDYKMPDGQFTKSDRTHYTLDYTENKINIQEENIPALIDEPYIDNLLNYCSFLKLELNSVRLPNTAPEFYSSDWETITRGIYFDEEFGSQISKKGYYEREIDDVVSSTTDPKIRMLMIYQFLKNKIRWNGNYGYLTENGVKNAYNEGSGNVAELNLILVSMLRYAGLEANPVLVSTKNNGIPILPTRFGFNYIICHISLPDNQVLLDATDLYAEPNVLPIRSMNWQGRLVKSDGTSNWINIQAHNSTREMIMIKAHIDEDFSIIGNAKNQSDNHGALKVRNDFGNLSTNEQIKIIEDERQGLEISAMQISNINKSNTAVTLDFDFSISDLVEEIGGKLYFSPMLFFAKIENKFNQETRKYPIDLQHTLNRKYIFNIKIPDGYKITSVPSNERVAFNGGQLLYTYLIKPEEDKLMLSVDFDRNSFYIVPESYVDLKDFYSRMVAKQEEKVVLEKI